MGLKASAGYLSKKGLVSSNEVEGFYQFCDLVEYKGYDVKTDDRGINLIDSYDAKDLMAYLECISHGGLFDKLKGEGLVENLGDFDELWGWAGIEGISCVRDYLTVNDVSKTKKKPERNLSSLARLMRLRGHKPKSLAKLLKV